MRKFGAEGQIRCIVGNVEVAYGVLIKSSAMLSQQNRFSLFSTKKYKKSVHYLNNCSIDCFWFTYLRMTGILLYLATV